MPRLSCLASWIPGFQIPNHDAPVCSVQFSCVRLFATPWIAAHQASLFITNSQSSPKLMSIKSVMPFIHLILCCPLLLLAPNPSQHQSLFQWVNSSHEVAKVLEFQLQHQSSNEYSGLISVKTDWCDLLVVQGTLKSLLQQHSSKASVLQHSAFFMVQSSPWATENISKALFSQHSDRARK